MEVLSTEYKGISAGAQELGTKVPSQLANDATHALEKLRDALGGDVSGFVAKRLHFSQKELFQALAMEQIDSVAMAIHNIEMRSQAVIIGDQTGIGKGRQAATMVCCPAICPFSSLTAIRFLAICIVIARRWAYKRHDR